MHQSEWKERQHGTAQFWADIHVCDVVCFTMFPTAPSRYTGELVMQCNSCGHSSRMGRIFLSLSCFPCDRQVFELKLIAFRPVVPSYNVLHFSPVLAVSPPGNNHSSTGIRGSTPSEVSVLRGLVQLVHVCQSNQQQLSLLRGEVSQLRDELRAVRAAPVPSSQAARVGGAPHSQSDATCPTSLCQVSSAILPRPARVRDARCPRAGHPVVPGSAGGMGAPQWCPGLAPAVSGGGHVRDALQSSRLFPLPFPDVIRQQVPIPPCLPKRFGGGNPMSDGPAIPQR